MSWSMAGMIRPISRSGPKRSLLQPLEDEMAVRLTSEALVVRSVENASLRFLFDHLMVNVTLCRFGIGKTEVAAPKHEEPAGPQAPVERVDGLGKAFKWKYGGTVPRRLCIKSAVAQDRNAEDGVVFSHAVLRRSCGAGESDLFLTLAFCSCLSQANRSGIDVDRINRRFRHAVCKTQGFFSRRTSKRQDARRGNGRQSLLHKFEEFRMTISPGHWRRLEQHVALFAHEPTDRSSLRRSPISKQSHQQTQRSNRPHRISQPPRRNKGSPSVARSSPNRPSWQWAVSLSAGFIQADGVTYLQDARYVANAFSFR